MNPFLHVVAEANERRLCSQAKWLSHNFFFIASGLRDSESQELFCRGQHKFISNIHQFLLNFSLNAQ